jgi:hypothetical protein
MQERTVLDMTIDLEDFFAVKVNQIIDNVSGNEPAQWGMMNAHEMLEHLVFPLDFAISETPAVLLTPEDKLQRQRTFLHSEFGMPRDFKPPFLPSDKTVPLIHHDLNASKQLLKDRIEAFLQVINAHDFTDKMHPIFGRLTKHEWLLFQYKHFMHHFMQFGLV